MNIRRDKLKNPLIRDGVNQRQRQTPALSPDFVQVDERNIADALVSAYQLSKQVKYYPDDESNNNEKDPNWQKFFSSSPLVQLALISKVRPQAVKDGYTKDLQALKDDRTEVQLDVVLEGWKTTILIPILDWYAKLVGYTPFTTIIQGLVKTNLTTALNRIQAIELAYRTQTTPFYKDFATTFGLELESPALPDYTPLNQDISFETLRDELDSIFQPLFQTYRQIIQQASNALMDSLKTRQDHPPALALYIAFWFVMKGARDDLNRMTQLHLDFFYSKVLRLPALPAQPDHAHLIFELAKNQTEHKLDAGIRFKAGKDASGKPLAYQLDEAIVVHKAEIASRKGLFLDLEKIADTPAPFSVHVSPQANSADGQGGDFPKEQTVKAWLPFGNKERETQNLGIVIASNIFYLQEGDRTITLDFDFDKQVSDTEISLSDIVKIEFSGEKKWIFPTNSAGEPRLESIEATLKGTRLLLTVSLSPSDEPIIAYHDKLPGAKLNIAKPVARIFIDDKILTVPGPSNQQFSPYQYFQSARLNSLNIKVEADKVRKLVVRNDLSVQNPAKPFQPFGPIPKIGSKFEIGSQEVFQKKITSLSLKLSWQGLPVDGLTNHYRGYFVEGDSIHFPSNFATAIDYIYNNTSKNLKPKEPQETSFYLFKNKDNADLKDTDAVIKISTDIFDKDCQDLTGFLRFTLGQDFFHDLFPSKYALQVLALSKDPNKFVVGAVYKVDSDLVRYPGGIQFSGEAISLNEPYTPVIQDIFIHYKAEANWEANVATWKDCEIFHLYPFDGFKPVFKNNTPSLIPKFIHNEDQSELSEGSLYIGLTSLDPPTALPIFFQVAEETADPELEKATVYWSYLKGNTWHSLDDRIVSDTTNGLIASGIVTLAIPEDIKHEKSTILDPTIHWVKASVSKNSGAICHIIGIHTQAAQVTFTNQDNDPSHLATPLAAGKIAKLKIPQPQVKKVKQPYTSFGGQVKELPSHFHTRISEHLRHKGRAVTIFDYERLVLEKFPAIYKVRCINHGQVNAETKQWQGLVPGSVAVAVIPDFSQRSSTRDLEPRVNLSQLQKIEQYLVAVSSPWITIKVVNPAYEYIQVECQVAFKPPYDGNFGYYRRQLDQDITRFLAPWISDAGAEISFGGKLYRSSVLNFVENLNYVDYVLDFKIHHYNGFDGIQANVREAIASTPRSILTSILPDKNTGQSHQITEVPEIPPARPPSLYPGQLGYTSLNKLILEENSPAP